MIMSGWSRAPAESMTHILHRQIGGTLPVAAGGSGIEIVDSTGKRYLDASGGAAVSCLGHGHPAVTAALHEQLDKLAYAHTGFFTTEVAEKLADRLIADAPQGISHAYLVSGGSEAIEAALKMARQYFIERGEPKRRHVIARRQSYHGNTLGALAAGGNEWRRAPFSPLLIETHHIAPCFAYRFQEPGESEEDYGRRAADALEAKILRAGRRHGDGLRRRDRGRRDRRRGAGGAGLLQAHPRDLRSPRRAADPRRGDVRHGPHRHACMPASRKASRRTS